MKKTTCAFTGHRPKSFPWKYDETARDCVLLKQTLAAEIAALAAQGVTDFLSGMALGADLWAAQAVLDLRRKNPAVKLRCILPCEGQERKWPAPAQEQYRSLLGQADEVVYVSRNYHADCMLERNRCLVDHSHVLLAVYNGTVRSGTGMTVRYAQAQGREVIQIDPVSREVTRCDVSNLPREQRLRQLIEDEKIIYSKRFPRPEPLAMKAAWEDAGAELPVEPPSLEPIFEHIVEESMFEIDPDKAALQQRFLGLAVKLSSSYKIDMDIKERCSCLSVIMYLDCATCSGELKEMFAELLRMSDHISSFLSKTEPCDFIIALDCCSYAE